MTRPKRSGAPLINHARPLSEQVQPNPQPDVLGERRRIVGRQSSGSLFQAPANDNQAWPLAAQLRKDGRDNRAAIFSDDPDVDLLSVAERYRKTYDAAHADALLIGTVADERMSLVQNECRGRRKGVKQLAGALPATDGTSKANVQPSADDGAQPGRMRRLRKAWLGEDLLIARIDSRRLLLRLQAALGPLLEPFEDAVLHGETLTSIGASLGAGQAAGGAGKAIVYLGLRAVQAELRRAKQKGAD